MRRPLSTKDKIEIRIKIERFLVLFSKIWKIEVIWRVKRIVKRADFRYSSDHHTALMITDASIKNNIATSILYIHSANWPLVKTVHYTSFVTTTEAKLFAIRCGINQACSFNNIFKIIVVTDSIHAAKKIFDCGPHPYQIHLAAIISELRSFFSSNESNTIVVDTSP